MSQIFTGSGLGLNNSSLDKLGSYGPQGNSKLGQGAEHVYINAANGNLILRHNDGYLADHDLGLNLVQTYNSQGQLSGNTWQFNVATKLLFTGSPNTAGSTVTRFDEAGHQSIYHFDETSGYYVSDSGSTERLSFDGSHWEYQSVSDDIKWRYDANGQLIQRINRDGLTVNYTFENGHLTNIEDSRGQKITFSYTDDLLTDVTATQDGTVIHHTHYEYDNLNRLKSVSQDLGDGKIYTTRYCYDGDSNRISDITQSDGTTFHIDYDAQGRVKQTIDGEGRTQRFDYLNNQTIITNDKNEQWTYSYDELGQLTAIDGPENLHIQYHYQGEHLESITQGDLRWRFEYNANGDCTKIIDEKGQVTERVFDANHHLVCETYYSRFDESHNAISPEHTYFIYDAKGHLRFEVAANGVVTEYQYDDSGNKTSVMTYLKLRLDTTNFNPNHLPTLEQLQSWAQEHSVEIDKADYEYDKLGQLIKQTHGDVVTNFVYDPAGRLIEKRDNYQGQQSVTTYVYDDLGRLILTTDNRGHTQRIDYEDANRQIITTDANGLKTIQLFDKSGLLLSTHKLDATHDFGTTFYDYDEAGRLKKTTEPGGQSQVIFYDAQGRKQAIISNNGEVTEYSYDAYGNLKQTKSYATLIDVSQITSNTDFASIRPNPSDDDREVTNLYNAYNQLQYRIDTTGAVIAYVYDAKGQVISETQYATRLESWQGLSASDITPQTSDDDRVMKLYYDELGNKIAEVNAEGYATEYQYDNRGLLIATTQYFKKAKEGDTWLQVKPADSPARDIKNLIYYDDSGNKIATIDGEGYLIEYRYDERGNLSQQISYYTKLNENSYDINSDIATLRPVSHANDHSIIYHYNDLNQLSEELSYTGLKTTYEYNEVGLVIKKTQTDTHTNQVRETRNRYDAMGRVIATLDEIGSALIAKGGLNENQIETIWQNHAIKFSYNLNGQVASKTNQLGMITQYFYDAENRLQFSVDADGNIVENRYNAFNQVEKEIHYSQRLQQKADLSTEQLQQLVSTLANSKHDEVITYHYTTTGLVDNKTVGVHQNIVHYNAFGEVNETITRLNSNQTNITRYQYDRRGLQTHRFEDINGVNRDIKYDYDYIDRLKREYDQNQKLLNNYTYDNRGNLIKIYNAINQVKTLDYDAYSRKVIEKTFGIGVEKYVFEYNDQENSFTLTQKDSGTITTHLNAFGDKVKVIDGNNNTTEFHFDEKGQLHDVVNADLSTIDYHYDDAGRLEWQCDGEGNKTSFTYDAKGNVLTKTLDPGGLNITTTYEYDGIGRQVRFTDPDGRITTFEYDDAGQLINQVTDPDGLNILTHFEYDEAGNKVLEQIIDANGLQRTVKYHYDNLNRLTQTIIDPDDLAITETLEYDARDNVITRIDGNSHATHFVYDANNQCRYSIDASGVVTENKFDPNGNLIETTTYANRIGALTHYDLDSLSQVIVNDPLSDQFSFFGYDAQGKVITEFNALGQAIQYNYDGNGNLTTKNRFHATATLEALKRGERLLPSSSGAASDHFTYDAMNRLQFSINSLGQVTEFRYDKAGNKIASIQYANLIKVSEAELDSQAVRNLLTIDSQDQHQTFVYDKANRLSFSVDSRGYASQFSYDGAGHCIETKRYSTPVDRNGDIPSQCQTSTHDRVSHSVFNAAGREVYRIGSTGSVSERRYDAAGNVIKEIAYADPLILDDYSQGSLKQALQSYTIFRETSFDFDKANRLWEIKDAQEYLEIFKYDGAGNVLSKTDKAGYEWTYTYDECNRLLTETSPQVSVTENINGSWQTNQRTIVTRYTYDSFGNKTKMVRDEGHVNQTTLYGYDNLNRLVKTTIELPVDNSNLSAISYNASRQEIMQQLTTEIVYDVFGNVAAEKDRQGSWQSHVSNSEGQRLFDIDAMGAITAYEYDAFGNVVKQTQAANGYEFTQTGQVIEQVTIRTSSKDRTIERFYDQANHLKEERLPAALNYDPQTRTYKANLQPVKTYAYNAFGECILERQSIAQESWAETHFYFDNNGKCRATINAEGYLTTFERNQFGEVIKQTEFANKAISATLDDYVPGNIDAGDRTIEMQYDRCGQLITKILKDVTTQKITSSNGLETVTGDLITRYTYDGMGNVTSTTDAANNTSYNYYDAYGNITAQVGPSTQAGRAASLFYHDSLGNITIEERWAKGASNASVNGFDLLGLSDADQREENFYDNQGQLIQHRDGMGHLTYYSHDANGNISRCWQEINHADGSHSVKDVRYQYDFNNRQVKTATFEANGKHVDQNTAYNSFGEIIQTDYEGNFKVTYEYDNLGRVWRTNKEGRYQIFLYNNLGNVTEVVESSEFFSEEVFHKGFDLYNPEYDGVINFNSDKYAWQLRRTDNFYDKLGRLVKQTKQRTEDYKQDASQRFVLDAWGNTVEQWDWQDHVTNFTYNKLNLCTQQIAPLTNVMDASGVITRQRPVTTYGYDNLGNQIAMTDANQHTVLKRYDAYGRVVDVIDAEGHNRYTDYDLLGNAITETNENGHQRHFTYDKNNRLTDILTELGVHTHFDYDESGNQIRQVLGDEVSTKKYDNRGNILVNHQANGFEQTNQYDEADHLIAQSDNAGGTQSWEYEPDFGRLQKQTDLGGGVTDYTYNTNGHVIEQKNSIGQDKHYYYNGDGKVTQYRDDALNQTVNYAYDSNGNLISKESTRLDNNDVQDWMRDRDTYEYDELGRLKSVTRNRSNEGDNLFTIRYDYDAANNIRHTYASVDFFNKGAVTTDEYFTYDANNRIRINKGALVNGNIQMTETQGSELSYDNMGNICDAKQYKDGTLNHFVYSYDCDERLYMTQLNGIRQQTKCFDQANRVYQETIFNKQNNVDQVNTMTYEKGLLTNQQMTDGSGKLLATTDFSYYAHGNLKQSIQKVQGSNGSLFSTTTHDLEYLGRDDYKLKTDNASTTYTDGRGNTTGKSERFYDVNGQLIKALDDNGEHTTYYLQDSIDGVKARRDAESQTGYLFVGGQNIGDLRIDTKNNTQTLDIYAGFTPLGQQDQNAQAQYLWQRQNAVTNLNQFASSLSQTAVNQNADGTPLYSPQSSLSSYTLQAGDSLQSIALAFYGDASLWYLIADANGLKDNQQLKTGSTITIPPAASDQHHTNATHRVYDASKVIGDTSATTPVPPPPPPQPSHHSKCSFAKVIIGVVAVVATVATAGALGLALGGIEGTTGLLATGAAVLGGATVGAAGIAGTLAMGFVAGFVGNIAAQAAGIALNEQHGINFGSALASGLGTAVSAGLGHVLNGTTGDALKQLANVGHEEFSLETAARAMLSDSASQATKLAIKRHQHFDWSELGASAVAGGLSGGKSGKAINQGLKELDPSNIMAGELNAIAGGGLQSAISGKHFDAGQVLSDNLGSSLGNGLVNSLKDVPAPMAGQALEDRIEADRGRADDGNRYSPVPAEGPYANPDGILESKIARAPRSQTVSDWSPEHAMRQVQEMMQDVDSTYNAMEEDIHAELNQFERTLSYDGWDVDANLFLNNRKSYKPSMWESVKTRGFGLLRAVGGAAEMAVAAALVEGGITAPLGYAVGLHAADQIAAGASQAISGNNTHGVTESALMQVGLSETNAELVDSLISIGNVAGKAGAVANVARLRQAQLVEMGEVAWTKGAKFSSKAYGYVMSNRVNIGGHALNAGLGGFSSYMAGKVTGSDTPYLDMTLGAFFGAASGYFSPASYRSAIKNGMISAGLSNSISQGVNYLGSKHEPISFGKLGVAIGTGAFSTAITFGAPAVSSSIISFVPDTAINAIGGAWIDHWNKKHA